MNTVFALGDLAGCGMMRCVIPGKELKRRGHNVTFISNYQHPAVLNCDIFIIQRQTSEAALEWVKRVRDRGSVVLFELDDCLHTLGNANPCSTQYSNGKPEIKRMEKIIRACNGMIVSTQELAQFYAKFSDTIFVCYNAIEDAWLQRMRPAEITGAPKREGQIRIGYAGSSTHRSDFESIALKPLVKLMNEKPEIRMVFIGDTMKQFFPLHLHPRIGFHGGTAGSNTCDARDALREDLPTHKYYQLINWSAFDIGIAPIERTTFNSGKSYLKKIEYGLLGIPCIASNHTPYRQYARESQEGPVSILASDDKEWYRGLKRLIEDPELRKTLATNNLAYVERAHVISKKVVQWENVIEHYFGEKKKELFAASA